MAAVHLGCWCRQGGDGKLKIAPSAEPGNQRAELLQASRDQPTRCFSACGMKCRDDAEQLCQGGRDGAKGEAALHTVSSEAHASSLEGFLQGKREVIQALAHGSSVWATGSRLYNHRVVFQCLCPAQHSRARPEPGTCGTSGKAQAASQSSVTAPEPPPDTARVGQGTGMKDLFAFACSGATQSFILPALQHPKFLSKRKINVLDALHVGGLRTHGKQTVSRGLCNCNIAWASPWKNPDNNRADTKWDFLHLFLSGSPGALCSKHTAWFWHRNKTKCWCDWDQATLPATAEPFPPASLCCCPAILHPYPMPLLQVPALTCKTLFQRYHEERAVTPDLKWDSKEEELALSPAFPVCIGSEKNRNYFNKPYICENSHFPRELSRKNKDGWLPGKVYRDFCMCFSA